MLSSKESQTKAISCFHLMVFHCAGKSIKGSKLSMTGINANTKSIYECLHKVRAARTARPLKIMDLVQPGRAFNFIP